MRPNEFLELYCTDGLVKTVAAGIKASDSKSIQLKNLSGSLDAVICAASFKLTSHSILVVLQDREEAAYFQNDLQNLLGREILLFPMSYKRPYEFDDTENANILMRGEVLNRLTNSDEREIIVTYPEALSELVINKRSLASNTFVIKQKEQLDTGFLEEFLDGHTRIVSQGLTLPSDGFAPPRASHPARPLYPFGESAASASCSSSGVPTGSHSGPSMTATGCFR